MDFVKWLEDISFICGALVIDILMWKFGFVWKYYKCSGSGGVVSYVNSNVIV